MIAGGLRLVLPLIRASAGIVLARSSTWSMRGEVSLIMTYVIEFLHGEVRVANVMVCSISTNGWLPLNYFITNAFFPMSSDFGLGIS